MNVGARAIIKFFLNSQNDLDLDPRTMKAEFARDIVILTIFATL